MSTRTTVSELSIGALGQDAGVNVETIRYYQRRGLLDKPAKPLGGHRRYAPSSVRRVRFIKRTQQLGFTLEEVKAFSRLEDGQSCGETRALAEHKLALIERRLASLNRTHRPPQNLIEACHNGKRARSCPIIATLSAEP